MKQAEKPNLEPEARFFVCYCEPKKVLPFVRELRQRDIFADSPSFKFRRRIPRRSSTQEIERPLIGGVFFLREDFWPIDEFLLTSAGIKRLGRMHWMGRPATVSASDLVGLKAKAAEMTTSRTEFRVGGRVHVEFGPFAGRGGTVISVRSREISVSIDGMNFPLYVAPFLLRNAK